jgi:hypothetical protein
MRYDLTDLKLFMAIAQAGNLSRALVLGSSGVMPHLPDGC